MATLRGSTEAHKLRGPAPAQFGFGESINALVRSISLVTEFPPVAPGSVQVMGWPPIVRPHILSALFAVDKNDCYWREADVGEAPTSAKCHGDSAPCWPRAFFHVCSWSVQPCVRPFNAVHMTAGIMPSADQVPTKLLAFDKCYGRVGCPDRRIDRALHYVLFASQPSHPRRCVRRISFNRASATGSLYRSPLAIMAQTFARSCWRARYPQPWSAASPARP